jgi:uncharacterized protein YjbJ (UPF0337 family)
MVAAMSFTDGLRNKAQKLRGRIKRNTGEVTGDRSLQARGRADEVKGDLEQTGEKIREAFRGRGRHRRQYWSPIAPRARGERVSTDRSPCGEGRHRGPYQQ